MTSNYLELDLLDSPPTARLFHPFMVMNSCNMLGRVYPKLLTFSCLIIFRKMKRPKPEKSPELTKPENPSEVKEEKEGPLYKKGKHNSCPQKPFYRRFSDDNFSRNFRDRDETVPPGIKNGYPFNGLKVLSDVRNPSIPHHFVYHSKTSFYF